jgi:hypothetical protein
LSHALATATAALALGLAASPAFAEQSSLHQAADPVPGRSDLVFADLVRLAVPDLAKTGDDYEGHLKANPRHLAGKEYEGDDEPDSVTLGYVELRHIRVGGKPRLLVLADLGPEPGMVAGLALLMLITDEPHPRLLDAADVGMDRDTGFGWAGPLPLGPGDDAFVTYSEHNDADLTLGGFLVAEAVGDHLKMVDVFNVTSENLCSWGVVEDAKFATAADPGRAYRRIAVTVSAAFKHTGDDGCNDEKLPPAGTHLFRASYRWDAAHGAYVAAASQLPALAKLNDKYP